MNGENEKVSRGAGPFLWVVSFVEMRLSKRELVIGVVEFGGGLAFADAKVVEGVGAYVVVAVFEQDADAGSLFDEVVLFDGAFAVGGFDLATHFGHLLVDFAVIGVFVFQTAHKPTAHTADFLRIEGETLDFRHFDGHLFKVG